MAGRKREPGNVGEILAMGLCVLALTAVMLSYMENVQAAWEERDKELLKVLRHGYV